MGTVVVHLSLSLDGYFEGPGRDISWHRVDEEVHRYVNEELAASGAFLSGRVTYELMAGFWPSADEDPAAPEVMVEFAGIWRDKPKVVYSHTLEGDPGWGTTLVREVVPAEVEALKERYGELVVGGADLVRTFRQLGLVDTYRLFVTPVVLGNGTALFPPGGPREDLGLVRTRTFGNGVVLLEYDVHPDGA